VRKPLYVILAFFMVIGACSLAIAVEDKATNKVIVYYFHGTFRCVTCTNMEKYAREAIEANFKDALQSGKLEFKAVNVEESKNEHFTKDYQLYTKSLILSFMRDGKEVRSKNLDRIWELARNRQKFIEYVAGEVHGFMKDAQ
jgi:hypothetical protein